VGTSQSQAAPWSKEQQGYFSSARFALGQGMAHAAGIVMPVLQLNI